METPKKRISGKVIIIIFLSICVIGILGYFIVTKFNNDGENITSNTFKVEYNAFSKEDDGRYTPFFNGYKPYVEIGNKLEIFEVYKIEGLNEMVIPGDIAIVYIKFDEKKTLKKNHVYLVYEGNFNRNVASFKVLGTANE